MNKLNKPRRARRRLCLKSYAPTSMRRAIVGNAFVSMKRPSLFSQQWISLGGVAALLLAQAAFGATVTAPAVKEKAAASASAPVTEKAASAPAQPVDPATQEQIERIKARVVGRWKALMARDYDAAYAFASPSYRKVFSRRQYFSNYGEQIRRDNVEVLSTEFTDEARAHAKVRVLLHYTTVVNDNLFHGKGGDWEFWALEDGQWWHVPKQ
jgi:hypothetical protein